MKYRVEHRYGKKHPRKPVKRPGRPRKVAEIPPEALDLSLTVAGVSASKRKLGFFAAKEATSVVDDAGSYVLAHTKKLDSLVGALACPECHDTSLKFAVQNRMGFAHRMVVSCVCGFTAEESTSPKIPEDDNPTRQPYEINRSVVFAGREVGLGHQEVGRFFSTMNVDGGLHQKTYQSINRKVMTTLVYGPAADTLAQSHEVVHQLYEKTYGPTDGPRNITVSYDGTWHARGHTSTLGAAFAIECHTGLVVDYCVLSKYCAECELVGGKLEGAEKELWQEAHKPNCDRNHFGSSGAMEVEGAKMLWARSKDVGNFAYTSLVGDGDAGVLDALRTLDPYPEPVEKEECINHISKRMYKGLERAVKDKSAGVQMGGRGRMTKERMKKWSSYYRKAIVENAPNVEAARQAVWAIFFHSISTPEEPHHTRCDPKWCWFRKAVAEGKDPKEEAKNNAHDPPLPKDVCQQLIPLFERLADPALLARCMTLTTSNANESLHSTVWKRAPKHKNCGRKTLETAAALAVIQYNKGAVSLVDVVSSLGIEAGAIVARMTTKIDHERIRRAEKAALNESKTQRKKSTLAKVRQEETLEAQEGHLYSAGGH